MAVVDRYVNADSENNRAPIPFFARGEELLVTRAVVDIAAADSDTSVFRLFRNVPTRYIPCGYKVWNTAITGGTDYDLGVYETDRGAVIDADLLASAISVASAHDYTNTTYGTPEVAVGDLGKPLYELMGLTAFDRPIGVDICLTANTVGTAAGTIVVEMQWVPTPG